MISNDVIDMNKELCDILGRIPTAKRIEENIIQQFVIVVSKEEEKADVETVASTLIEQANKMHVGLEIMVATEAEVQDAKDRLASLMEN